MTTVVLKSQEKFSLQWFLSWGAILLGSAILALAIVIFVTPYKIVPGGVYGLGIVLNNFFPDIQVGTFGLILDVPLLILAFYALGSGVGAKTIFSAIVTPLLMNVFTNYIGTTPETLFGGAMDLRNDMFLAAIFGGATMGVGLGIIFKNHGTSGGTDIVSMIVSKYMKIPLPKSIIFVESGIIMTGLLIGDWKLPMYSVITIFVLTRVVDCIIEGVSSDKLLYIITNKHEEMRQFILHDLQRGGTYIKAEGMYTKEEKNIIFVVIDRKQLPLVQDQIKTIDDKAFVVVVEAHETLGSGFKPFSE